MDKYQEMLQQYHSAIAELRTRPVSTERLGKASSILIVRSASWRMLALFRDWLQPLVPHAGLGVLAHRGEEERIVEIFGKGTECFCYPVSGPYTVGALNAELHAKVRRFTPQETIVLCEERVGVGLEEVLAMSWELTPRPLLIYNGIAEELVEISEPLQYCGAARRLTKIYAQHAALSGMAVE